MTFLMKSKAVLSSDVIYFKFLKVNFFFLEY